jgi:hypothetical protein
MSRATKDLPTFERRNLPQVMLGPQRSGADTLLRGVCEVFPLANPRRLERCLQRIAEDGGVEGEAVPFVLLLCGTAFSIEKPDVKAVLEDLWTWLTGHPRNMPAPLAELVVETLAPGLKSAATRRRGWRVGPKGRFERRPGKPPEAMGAWTAALVMKHFLELRGLPRGKATAIAIELVSVLRGRSEGAVDPTELGRSKRMIRKIDVPSLTHALFAQYDSWLIIDGRLSGDPMPETPDRRSHASWRRRHRMLPHVLVKYGARTLALLALDNAASAVKLPRFRSH